MLVNPECVHDENDKQICRIKNRVHNFHLLNLLSMRVTITGPWPNG